MLDGPEGLGLRCRSGQDADGADSALGDHLGQAAARPYIDLALEIRNKHALEGAHDAETTGLF